MPFRKVTQYHHDFLEIIHKVADCLHLDDIAYTSQFGTEDIDHFAAGSYKITLKGNRDGQKVKLHVILKWHPDQRMRKSFRDLYRRQYIFYQHIVPELLEIQRRYGIIEGLKMKFPNCIYASVEHNKETIVVHGGFLLEGFRIHDRFHRTDLPHASLAVKHLAKLHALSFALEKLNPAAFEVINSQCQSDVQYSNTSRVSKSMEYYYNASVSVVSDAVAKEKLKALAPSFLQVLNKCTVPVPYSTICHGDCWNNNVLFKYKNNKPIDVLFVDHELIRYASPVADLSYFLYMSTDRSFLLANNDRILDLYYSTLTAVLRQCNLDVDDIYPRHIFEKHLRQFSVLGLIEALVSMKIITADSEEAFKMTEQMYCLEEDIPEEAAENRSFYIERVNGVVEDFFERGYSLDAVLNTS